MPYAALSLCLLFTGWFVIRDFIRRRTVSAAVWIPTALLLILGSRPLSLWLSGGIVILREMGNDQARSVSDEIFFAVVLGGSLLVATLRGFKWNKLFGANMALMLFYLYFVVSVGWSGDPAGSVKRIVKDFALLFVVGLILSEKDPLQAMRAIYVRCAFVLFPLSIVLIKYFPDYGRAYSLAGDVMITGVTTQKNSLGEIAVIFTLFLVWDYMEARKPGKAPGFARVPWDRLILLLIDGWLLHLSQSKTALVCTLVGVFLIVRSDWLVSKTINRIALAVTFSLPIIVFFSHEFAGFIAPLVQALGRSMTFTGRTDIWAQITSKTVNPLIGAGYWNFWGGPGGYAISQVMRTNVPNAHCGYVDIYLDGGIVGLVLLITLLMTSGHQIIKRLNARPAPDRYERMRFAVLIAAMIYNLSESTFFRMGPIWFTTLLMIVDYPPLRAAMRKARESMQSVPKPRIKTSAWTGAELPQPSLS